LVTGEGKDARCGHERPQDTDQRCKKRWGECERRCSRPTASTPVRRALFRLLREVHDVIDRVVSTAEQRNTKPKYHGIVETYREIFDDLNPTTQDGGGGQGGGGDSLETSPSSLQQCPVEVRNGGEESTTPRGSPPSERVVVREGVQVLDDLKNSPPLRKDTESVVSWVLAKIYSKIK
jgi:hypothetical protein